MRVNAAEIITKSIMNDLIIQVNTIIENFYNSDEFKKKVERIKDRREEICVLVNKMDDLIPDEYKKSSSITLFNYTFYYSEEDDYWNMSNFTSSCEDEAKVEEGSLNIYAKINYIRDRVFAIVLTLDELDYTTIKQIIDTSIDIEGIIFNKDI